ncbi:MAG: uroporphyrinogen decarboxylase family protein, partial [Armatimonadota bacterium]
MREAAGIEQKWSIAFCNVTYTEYAGVTYADYYGSPAVMLEAQLAAKDYAEQRWGVGRFIRPHVDSPPCRFASYLGMTVIWPESDELPYIDSTRPVVRDPSEVERLRIGDPREEGLMATKFEHWQYFREHGHDVGFGGGGGGVVTNACEVTNGEVLTWLGTSPAAAKRLLERIVEAHETVARFGADLAGGEYAGFGYTGDDYAGLMSPSMFREFAVPCYARLYADNERRFMHSELLRAPHLRIARDELGITDFHGAGCELLTLEEMREIMGHAFWTQLTPQEML